MNADETSGKDAGAVSEGSRMFQGMFNVGVKAPDLDAEIEFLGAFDPDEVERVKRDADFGPKEIVSVSLAGTRLFLFPSTVYDEALESRGFSFAGGIGHVSFMTADMDEVLESASKRGIEPILGPYEVTPQGHGRRRVAFFRSPNGTIIEAQQLVEAS